MKIELKNLKKVPRTRIKQKGKIVDISKKKYNRQKIKEVKIYE